jgi:N-methylhydantoinase A/oxoprolinase/acetone carboxylase beta subunit
VGQGYEIEVPLARAAVARADPAAVREAFARTYAKLFGRTEAGVPIEVVSWRLSVLGPRPAGQAGDGAAPLTASELVAERSREAWFDDALGYRPTPVYRRECFVPGSTVAGPALIEERESTVVVPPGARVRCDARLNLVVDLPDEEARRRTQQL